MVNQQQQHQKLIGENQCPGFPYSGNESNPSQKRMILYHTRRSINGNVDGGLLFARKEKMISIYEQGYISDCKRGGRGVLRGCWEKNECVGGNYNFADGNQKLPRRLIYPQHNQRGYTVAESLFFIYFIAYFFYLMRLLYYLHLFVLFLAVGLTMTRQQSSPTWSLNTGIWHIR